MDVSTSSRPAERGLARTLTLPGAIALALGICLGAGLLILTGLAYQRSGNAAIYTWLIEGVMLLPMLAILAYLGTAHSSAAGVAGIARTAFGPAAGSAVQALLIGTFSLGLPGISIVGGNYFAFLVGGGRHTALFASAGMLVLTCWLNVRGVRVSGAVQRIMTFSLVTIVALGALAGLLFASHDAGSGIAPLEDWQTALPSLGITFFAFTGFILVASTVEEYKNAARDYPRAIFITFGIAFCLYLLIALAIQLTLSRTDPRVGAAPVAAMLSVVLGPVSGKLAAAVGVLVITTNLNGATWGFSRLVMASARSGLLPAALSTVDARTQVPMYAVVTSTSLFLVTLACYAAEITSLPTLLSLAGQNFFVLYMICVVSFVRIVPALWLRLVGAILLLGYVVRLISYQNKLAYPIALICAGAILHHVKARVLRSSTS